MSSSYRSNDTSSVSKNEGDSFVDSPPETHRFSSPPPGEMIPSGKSYYSPPPAPRFFAMSVGVIEPNADSVLKEINTGRSIINPTRMDISCISLSRKLLYKEFDCEDEDEDFNRIISPSFPQWPPPSSPDGVGEKVDLDMPPMPCPINLLMRTEARTPPRMQTTPRISMPPRPSVRFYEHDFIPIRLDDDDEGNQTEGQAKVDRSSY
jgi:hypothetical protein